MNRTGCEDANSSSQKKKKAPFEQSGTLCCLKKKKKSVPLGNAPTCLDVDSQGSLQHQNIAMSAADIPIKQQDTPYNSCSDLRNQAKTKIVHQ